MCGIVAILQYKSQVSKELRAQALSLLFSDAMRHTESRGADATGVFQVHSDGDWMLAKKGQKVSEWLFQDREKDEPVYKDFLETWKYHHKEITSLVGHCRKATVGSRGSSNVDNHPFALQIDERHALLGCHNGTLHNHDVIFDKLPDGLERQGKTDSEVIFHLIWHLTERGQKPVTGEVIKELGRRLDGAFACVVVNSKFPNKIATFRDSRPLEFFIIKPLNVVVVSSEKKIVQTALSNYELYRAFANPDLPKLSYDDRALMDRDWRIFDTSLEFPVGTTAFQSIEEISDSHGEIRSFNYSVNKEWKSPSNTSSGSTHYGSGGSRSGATSYPTQQTKTAHAKVTKSHTTSVQPSQTSTKKTQEKDDDVVVTAEAEVVELDLDNDKDCNRAFEEVSSLAICPAFDSEKALARSLGFDSLDNLGKMALANRVGKVLFRLGYAVSRVDHQEEIAKWRRGSRELTPKLELAKEKHSKAQQHVWTHKQLMLIILSLAEGGYEISKDNVEVALRFFPGISEDNKQAIFEAYERISSETVSHNTLTLLRRSYKDAEERTARQRQKVSRTVGE